MPENRKRDFIPDQEGITRHEMALILRELKFKVLFDQELVQTPLLSINKKELVFSVISKLVLREPNEKQEEDINKDIARNRGAYLKAISDFIDLVNKTK